MLTQYPPIVVSKSRTIKLGSESTRRETNTLTIDMEKQGLADVRWMIQRIAADETLGQVRINNPPSLVEVDNKTNKATSDVNRKIEVVYGVGLPELAMRLIEGALRDAIEATTTRRTGKLAAVGSSWQWTLIQAGRARTITSSTRIDAFGPNDYLILAPVAVPYATLANMRVASGGKLSYTKKNRKTKARERMQLGFLAYATRQLKRKATFANFAIFASFTQAYKVPGELSRKQGTGVLMIRARRRLGGASRRR